MHVFWFFFLLSSDGALKSSLHQLIGTTVSFTLHHHGPIQQPSGRQLTSNTQTHLCTCSLWPYNLAPLFLLCWLGSLQHYLLHRPPFFFYFSCHAHKGLNHRGFATHHANGCSGQTFHFITRLQVNMQLGIMASLPSLTNKNLHQKTFPSASTTHCFS